MVLREETLRARMAPASPTGMYMCLVIRRLPPDRAQLLKLATGWHLTLQRLGSALMLLFLGHRTFVTYMFY